MAAGFAAGARRALPTILSLGPFAVLFGAIAVDNGLTPTEAVVMSATVYAGASQMVGIELFGHHAAPWVIALSIFVVNLRHLLYSATTGRHMERWPFWQRMLALFFLVDAQFAETERAAEMRGGFGMAWYLGLGLPIYAVWIAATAIGAAFGRILPDTHRWGIDFLLTVYFIALVMGFRRRTFWLPVVLVSAGASVLAFKVVGSPWHVSLGALAGVVFAAAFGAGTGSGAARGNAAGGKAAR